MHLDLEQYQSARSEAVVIILAIVTNMTDLLPTQLGNQPNLSPDDNADHVKEVSHFEEYAVFARGLDVLKSSLDQPQMMDSHQLHKILATLIHIVSCVIRT